MANKIKYGVKNVYYAKITEGAGGAITYGTPVALKGAVSISLSQVGDVNDFYADNVLYWKGASNSGYEGSLELALIPESFNTDILGMTTNTDGVVIETASDHQSEFALMFQFEGDESARRHLFYRCTAQRPDVAGTTKEQSITPQTETINISAMPRIADDLVKASCGVESTAYANWFTEVYEA